MKFEEKLKELDKIIEMLQNPEIELEKSMELYQRGIELNKACNSELEDMKLKILTINGDVMDL